MEFYNFQKNSEMENLGFKTRMGTNTPKLVSGFVGFQNLKILMSVFVGFSSFFSIFITLKFQCFHFLVKIIELKY